MTKPENKVEVVPAVLRRTYEDIAADWERVRTEALHIQIDITDGVFAGEGTFREVSEFKRLPESDKIDLHMMVQTPSKFVEGIMDLNPARCVFHVEAFAGSESVRPVYETLRRGTTAELGLAINPDSPAAWIEEHLALVDLVLFMGYRPGQANQPLDPRVMTKMAQFREQHPEKRVAVDGHVNHETIQDFVRCGAQVLYSNTAVFGKGDPVMNLRELQRLAEEFVL